MSRPRFLQGVLLALVLSLGAAAAFAGLGLLVSPAIALRAVIALLGGLYVLYLLRHAATRVGRPTVLLAWLLAATGLWLSAPALGVYLAAHVSLVWLVRALYHHAGVLAAGLDAALSALALAAAVWAALGTHSVFAAVWCFFLVQALFVALPDPAGRDTSPASSPDDARFRRALRSAEAAVRRLHAVDHPPY